MKDLDYDDMEAKYIADLISQQNYFGICWPNHCKKCGGWGLFHFTQNHGEPWLNEHLTEPCECTLDMRCSRCGQEAEEGEGPCVFCGWNYDDGMPSLY